MQGKIQLVFFFFGVVAWTGGRPPILLKQSWISTEMRNNHNAWTLFFYFLDRNNDFDFANNLPRKFEGFGHPKLYYNSELICKMNTH